MMEDESLITLDTIPFTHDNFFTKHINETIHYNAITAEDGSYIINEGSSGVSNTYFKVEAAYNFRDDNEYKTIFDLWESTHWHLRMEDSSHTIYEDGTRTLLEIGYVKAPLVELETEHYDTMGYHLRMENEEYLQHEDLTYALVEGSLVKEEKKEIEFNPYISSFWLLKFEDDDHILSEDGVRLRTEQDPLDQEQVKKIFDANYESTGYHLKFEDDDHVRYEDNTRLILDDLEFAQPDITKHYVTENAASDIKHWTPGNHLLNTISTYKDKYIGATYGLQPFRPHFISQWSTAGLGFVDDKFTMEDDTGLIILEHPVTNQDYLLFEDFPEVILDMMNAQREVLDFILLEDVLQTDGAIDGNEKDYIVFEENTESGQGVGTARGLLETSKPPAEGYGVDFTPHQAWTVLPAYQYSRIPKRLKGTITFTDGGTTGTGAASLFTEELKIGDEFQTANENIINEDTGGGVLLETDERIEHEEIRIFHVQNEDLAADLLGTAIKDFRWLITTEDTTVSAHGTHAGVIGEYSSWDTALESYWIVTGDTNSELGLGTETNTAGYPGGIERETPEWEHNNMLWEDLSKQLITEPQAFIVGAITNDTSLTVTRKHLGGTDGSIFLVP